MYRTMRFYLFVVVMTPFFAFAQGGKRDVLNPERLEFREIELEAQSTAPTEIKLPFSSIRIIDSRPDTSKIGYMPFSSLSKKKSFRKIGLKGGVGNAIESYYNQYYENSFTQNDFELLIVMKKFWISRVNNTKNIRVELTNRVNANSYTYYKWEYYIGKNGKYLPVKRIDTMMNKSIDLAEFIDKEFDEKSQAYLKYDLKTLIEILDFTNAIKEFERQPKKTLEEINEFNGKRNLIPILLDSNFKRGVYLSYEEFKNNKPSIVDYREKKMRYRVVNTENYLEDMNGVTISNYWGYSDGTIFRYGMLGNEKVYRVQNTYCFFIKVEGYEIYRGNETAYNTGSGINTTSKSKFEIWVPYQLDMETGLIY